MFCPPPPQSNIELAEKTNLVYKRVIKSNDLLANSAIAITPSLELNTFYYADLRREEDIREFIGQHDLATFIQQTEQHIKKHFPYAVIKKELHIDPEEDFEKLYLTIVSSSMSRKEVLKSNRKLFTGWELAKNKNFNTYINVTARAV